MQDKVAGLRVFKFGGASVKDAAAILNLCAIVKREAERGPLLVVVSAMGKTTNALEEVYERALAGQHNDEQLRILHRQHFGIMERVEAELGDDKLAGLSEWAGADGEFITDWHFDLLARQLGDITSAADLDEQYDRIISRGELLSAELIGAALGRVFGAGFVARLNAPELVRTDATWREGGVDWPATGGLVRARVQACLDGGARVMVAEGFVGGTADGRITTLGREGSDYSAAIFAYCLRAGSVTIWKDVPGLLNADPKVFADTVLYPEISYRETIEMAFYGASVIHPKTLKPLAERGIPLYVRSFLDPAAAGTVIHDCQHPPLAPAFIRKTGQCLVSFESKDFAFISEENLAVIFAALVQAKLKINVMQNSAISFSVCTDYSERRLGILLGLLGEQFRVHYNSGLVLFTIKNYNAESINRITKSRQVLLEQRTRGTFQAVCAT